MKSSGSGTRVVLLWHTQSTFALLLTNDKRLQQQHALKNVRIMSSEDKTPRHCGKNVWEQLKKKKRSQHASQIQTQFDQSFTG